MTIRAIRVPGYCPMGCGQTLFAANGGHITCSYLDCPNPCAVDDLLHDSETEHIVRFEQTTFSVQHPLRERLNGELFSCDLHQQLSARSGPPAQLGRYRVVLGEDGAMLSWTRLG